MIPQNQLTVWRVMFAIRTMSIDDYDAVIELFKTDSGISLRGSDSRENTERYLQRNPNLSFVAHDAGHIVGCIMSGHDGRRGYLQHLIVRPAYRQQGIAQALIQNCLSSLEAIGILKSHIDVLKHNKAGADYWQSQGWSLRTDIDRYSFIQSTDNNV